MRKYSGEQLDYLRLRARQGVTTADHGIPEDEEGLSEKELGDIIVELEQTPDASHERSIDTAYQRSLIGVIYYAGFPGRERYRTVLEPFLHDPYHAPDILTILCGDWDLAVHYKRELREFIRGMPWDSRANDPISHCQRLAINFVAEKWPSLTDPTLLREVLALYERIMGHPRGPRVGILVYWSLCKLLGNLLVTEVETVKLAKELASRLEAAPKADLGHVSSTFISAIQPEPSVGD
jgi:hypothetical protein